MNSDDVFNDDDKFELEAVIADAHRVQPDLPRHRLVRDILQPLLETTLGPERATWAARWLQRNVDPANDIPAEEYLEILGEVRALLAVIEAHVRMEDLTEDERITVDLANTLSDLHALTEEWKNG